MKYVSCRQNFTDTDHLAPLQVQNGPLHPEHNEILFVHGYNSRFNNVLDAYRSSKEQYLEVTKQGRQWFSGFFWPGFGQDWIDSVLFRRAQAQADRAAVQLAEYLGQGPKISIMTHSLGARVTLEAILKHDVRVKNLYLTGPAIDNEHLRSKYAPALSKIDQIHVFWSKNDDVLCRLYRLSQFDKALGCSGPDRDLPGVKAYDVSDVVKDHGAYRRDNRLWEIVAQSE